MKRLHVHVSVENIADSIRFYSGMFGADRPWESRITPNGSWTIHA